jgi:mannosyltransferase OCH1-like enzyme
MSIPFITHQIWIQGWDQLPEKYKSNVKRLHDMNPEYEHKQWDENSLREECALLGKPYVDKFDSFPHFINRVDFGRYVVLYRYGGFSIDTDMKPLKSLRETPGLKEQQFIISGSAFPGTLIGHLNNALIITSPKNPIMKSIVDTITRSTKTKDDYSSKEIYTEYETGPNFVKAIVLKHKANILILDNDFFEPCFSVDPICKPSKDTIMDHQHTMSWIHPIFQSIFKILFALLYFAPILVVAGVAYFIYRYSNAKGRSR